MTQPSLFPDHEHPANSSDKELGVYLPKFKNKVLSKNQLLFNKYSKKIETLRKTIAEQEIKLNRISAYALMHLKPVEDNYAKYLVDFAKKLHRIWMEEKLSKKTKEKLSELIAETLADAFLYITPDDETSLIYNKHSETTLEEEEQEGMEMLKEVFGNMFSEMFGKDIDFSDVESPEDFAKKMGGMQEDFENIFDKENEKRRKRKLTKKEIENELREKQEQEIKNKNLRTIYTSLAKLLHPDLEQDASKQFEKEQLMKQVTAAYQEKDIHTLLKLEIEVIYKESKELEHLTDAKTGLLVDALKEQAEELEMEKQMLEMNPKYDNIREYSAYSEKRAFADIKSDCSEMEKKTKKIIADTTKLKEKKAIPYLKILIKKMDEENKQDNFFDDMSEEDMKKFFNDMLNSDRKGKF